MLIHTIEELPSAEFQAVIINVGTRLVTTLALMSALNYADMKVLLIDCESRDGSFDHFTSLMDKYDFDLLSAPLNKHGYTLDHIFNKIPAEHVLLVDSDAEILTPDVISEMKESIKGSNVFGAGFAQESGWLDDRHKNVGFESGYLLERMWIPLTLLKTAYVREALGQGHSFIDRVIYNDFAPLPVVGKVLKQRFRFKAFKKTKLSFLDRFKQTYDGHKPSFVYCDTGADIFRYLKRTAGYQFVQPSCGWEASVAHYHGITRILLDPAAGNGTNLNDIVSHVKSRLKECYDISC